MHDKQTAQTGSIFQSLIFFCGLLIFICFIQLEFPRNLCSVLGIILSGRIILSEIRSFKDLPCIFDVKKPTEYFGYFFAVSILLGLFWGIVFRQSLNIPIIPEKPGYFAFIAMAIGMVEELIFRGYIQRKLRNIGIVFSIFGASLMHAFYKCFIFIILPVIHPTDFFYLFIWTFVVGSILGALKEFSGNSLVPVSGHAMFDLIVYGDGRIDTWWVWL